MSRLGKVTNEMTPNISTQAVEPKRLRHVALDGTPAWPPKRKTFAKRPCIHELRAQLHNRHTLKASGPQG